MRGGHQFSKKVEQLAKDEDFTILICNGCNSIIFDDNKTEETICHHCGTEESVYFMEEKENFSKFKY